MQDGTERALSFYDRGRTPLRACRQDPRFSWCAYVPEGYETHRSSDFRLLVAVHGTLRVATLYRDAFAAFAERHRLIVLAPLFPGGIAEDKETWEITIRPGNAWYMDGADLAGPDRLARLRALKASFETAGIAVRHDMVPDAGHRMEPMVPAVEDFLTEALASGIAVAGTTATRRLA